MSVTLRAARSTDAGTTGAILKAFCRDTPWMPVLHTGAETVAFCGLMIDRGWVTVAEENGKVIGFLARDGEWINALYLDLDYTGRGIGAQLLNTAKAETDRLRLWTFQANIGAQSFYEREDFAEVERTDGAGNDENLPDIAYLWTKEALT